jgi:hypothetical protein
MLPHMDSKLLLVGFQKKQETGHAVHALSSASPRTSEHACSLYIRTSPYRLVAMEALCHVCKRLWVHSDA